LLSDRAGRRKSGFETSQCGAKGPWAAFAVEGNDLSVSGSIGLALSGGAETSFDELLRQADLALFEAKGNGGAEARIFRPEMAERSERFLRIEAELTEALRRHRLELFYQPRLSLRTGKIVAAEALIRITKPSGPAVMPAEFIPVAEATGRIAPIGRWALREAARHLVLLRQEGARLDLSVNVSPKQFTDPAFLKQLRQARTLLDPVGGVIELEITESVLVEHDRRLQKVMRQISEMGYTFAIDDFGTAYSNLAGISRYPVNCIKIDKTLIAHKEFRALVTAVLTLARVFGAKVVAEGVETEEQRQWLEESQCDEFQGYLFSRPVPFTELQRLIAAGY
jgi:EAL domain-containing protein (putative c-di-GMP-specific phosphodiesterase class I)